MINQIRLLPKSYPWVVAIFWAWATLVLSGGLANSAFAQAFSAQHFSYQHGLGHNRVYDIIEDQEGFLWVGTYTGLARYDGYRFETMDAQVESGQTHSSIRSLSLDSLGNLWIIGFSGSVYQYLPQKSAYDFTAMRITQGATIVDVYHTQTSTYLASPHTVYQLDQQTQLARTIDFGHVDIHFIYVDRQERLWVGTSDGLVLVGETQHHWFTRDPEREGSINDSVMLCMTEDHQGRLWIGTRRGVNLLKGLEVYPDTAIARFQRFSHLNASEPNDYRRINSIQEVDTNRFLVDVAGSYSLLTYTHNAAVFEPILSTPPPADNVHPPIGKATTDSQGNLWFANGRENTTLYHHQRPTSRPSAGLLTEQISGTSVLSLYTDSQGNVWVGTGEGLYQFNVHQKLFKSLTVSNHLKHNDTYSLFVDSRQWLWIGTLEGITVLDQDFNPVLDFDEPIRPEGMNPWNIAGSFAEDEQGRVLVGFYDGQIARYDVDRQRWHYWHETADGGLKAWSFRDIYCDTVRVTWAASANRGLVLINQDTAYQYHSLTNREDEKSFFVWSIHQDPTRESILWLGTLGRGVIGFDKDSGRSWSLDLGVDQPDAFHFLDAKNIYFDPLNRMWITTNNGLFILDSLQRPIEHLTTEDGLPSNDCQALINDGAGNVWVSTNAGIAKISSGTQALRTYSQEDGLASNFFNERGAARGTDGTIFLGSKGGVVYFQPKDIRANPYPGRPRLTDFSLSGTRLAPGDTIAQQVLLPQAMPYTKSITLPHNLNDFGIHFTSLNFAAPSHNRFKYQLQGYDQGWKYTDSEQRHASYMNLPAGEYTFILYTANADNRWSAQPATVQIILHPPWWQTLWFRALLVVGILAFFFLILYVRTRRLKEQKLRLEQTVSVRTQALRAATENVQQQKDRMDYQYSLLRMLAQIGQNITASIQAEDIIQKSYTHINKLMDAPCLSVGLVDKEKNLIRYYGFYDRDSLITSDEVSLSDQSRLSVWCVTNTQTVVMNDVPNEVGQYLHRSTNGYTKGHTALSSIYLPLTSYNQEVVGILIAKSFRKNAYGAQEVETLQYLANFISIALNNAIVYQQLEQYSDRLEKLDQHKTSFFTNVSHEFKTPLTLILGPIGKMLEDSPDRKDHALLEIVHNNALRLSRLVNELLELQRVDRSSDPLVKHTFDLVAYTERITHLFSFVSKQNNIELSLQTNLLKLIIDADPDKLELILYNLLSNAIKYAKGATKIRIQIQQLAERQFTLTVQDDGVGIPPSVGERIFERFMTYDTATSTLDAGTGVGLALVKHYVVLHGWQIHLNQAEAQQGASFVITLPTASADSDAGNYPEHSFSLTRTYVPAERPVRPTATRTITAQSDGRLLIVEDNPDLRHFLQTELQEDYQLDLAEDPIAALEVIEYEEPDLIITDWMMPAMTGQEFCKQLKQSPRFNHIPIIMMTARSGEEDELASFRDGAEQYLSKPFSMQVLRARIASLLDAKARLHHKLRRDWMQRDATQLEGSPEETFVRSIKEVIEQRYTDPDYRIDSLSAEIGLSRTQLYRKCKRILQNTPNEMLQNYRLNKSLAYLEKGYTVAEAAYAVGFNDPKYFARCFKATYNKSPRQAILNS